MNSLIDIGKLSEPATKLIEKISDAIGVLYEPTKMKREAKARMEIEKLELSHKIELSELQKRALERFIHIETINQANIEEIAVKAIPKLNEDSRPGELKIDWLTYFFEHCKHSSEEEIQEIWAEILSGEANSPGRISKRTINILSAMDKKEAEVFSKLTGVVWHFEEENHPSPTPIVFGHQNDYYNEKGLTFSNLSLLEAAGLIHYAPGLFAGYSVESVREDIIGSYNNETYRFYFKEGIKSMSCGVLLFSKAGMELYSVIPKTYDDDFKQFALERWEQECTKIEKISTPK